MGRRDSRSLVEVELCVSVTPPCTPTITPYTTVVGSILVGVMRRPDDEVAKVIADDEVAAAVVSEIA